MKISTAEFVLSAVKAPQLLTDDLPQIAFVGRSNVGKSSLLNKVIGRKALARTSSRPGRTQAVNYFLINGNLHFVDLPGYGYAKASKTDRQKWAYLMDDYFRGATQRGATQRGATQRGATQRAAAHQGRTPAPVLLVHLIDGKVGATRLDCEAHEYLSDLGHEMLKVATKIDRVKRGQRARNLAGIRQSMELPESVEIVPFSAVSGEGLKQLWRGIDTFLGDCREERSETGP